MDRVVLRRAALYALLGLIYLASTVPVGLFIYSIKTKVGLDFFKHGGLHAYMQCLSRSFPLTGAGDAGAPYRSARLRPWPIVASPTPD